MPNQTQLHIAADQPGPVISRHLFGHFAEHLGRCIYDGLWVGEDSPVPNVRGWRSDLVAALRQIRIPNLRWPGGCFADDYHWRDGIGPRAQRPRRINAHWGGVLEDNAVGTHEFLDLCGQLGCGQLGCEPYLAGNVGSGTPRELREWVEYCNAAAGTLADKRTANGRREPWRVRLWGIGNENWGCGGNMRPEYYADLCRRFSTYTRDFPDAPLCRVACGPNADDFQWTEVVMRDGFKNSFGHSLLQGLSLHYYTQPGSWDNKRPASPFDHDGWNEVMARGWRMDALVREHGAIMDRHDPDRSVALVVDEWGAWYASEPGTNPGFLFQQQTVRDAVLAALTLNVFIGHCERVRFANLAQIVNVLQAVALTEPGAGRLVLTPTWHVFALYAAHQEARRLPVRVEPGVQLAHAGQEFPQVSAAASLGEDGAVTLTCCNTDPAHSVACEMLVTGGATGRAAAQVVRAPELTTCNTYAAPGAVTAHPLEITRGREGGFTVTLPPGSVAGIRLA